MGQYLFDQYKILFLIISCKKNGHIQKLFTNTNINKLFLIGEPRLDTKYKFKDDILYYILGNTFSRKNVGVHIKN